MLPFDPIGGPILRLTVEVLGGSRNPPRQVVFQRAEHAEVWQEHDLLAGWIRELTAVSADRHERSIEGFLKASLALSAPELDTAHAR